MSDQVLDVYFHDQIAGKLIQGEGGKLSFHYIEEFLEKSSMGISISLPLQSEYLPEKNVRAFFSGLLPDENLRLRLAKVLGISEKNSFGLLKEVGGECAGALSLYPEGQEPSEESEEIKFLSTDELKEVLVILQKKPFLVGEEKPRLSLAGAQNKLAIWYEEGEVAIVGRRIPTTHILKPVNEVIESSVYNELFCMRLAKKMGIEVPKTDLIMVDDIPCYLIERYDRKKNEDGQVRRIHQEDFCQALGIAPELKYQKEGGPSISQCQELILNYSLKPAADLFEFMKIIIFNYLIGNSDAHGKNFSMLYQNRRPSLAPAYDLLSTQVYPNLAYEMSMKFGSAYHPDQVVLRYWLRLVSETKSAQKSFKDLLQKMLEEIVEKANDLKNDFHQEKIYSPVIEKIIRLVQERSTLVLAELV
jgi:serine/threonine-protein kinase HipA